MLSTYYANRRLSTYCLSLLCLILPYIFYGQKPELVLPIIHGQELVYPGLSFSGDGKYLASCSAASVKIWEYPSGKLIRTIVAKEEPKEEFRGVAFSSNGQHLLLAHKLGLNAGHIRLSLYDISSGKHLKTIAELDNLKRVANLQFSVDDQYITTEYYLVDENGRQAQKTQSEIWKMESGQSIWQGNGKSVRFLQDTAHFYLLDSNLVQRCAYQTLTTEKILEAPTEVKEIGIDHQSRKLHCFSDADYNDPKNYQAPYTYWLSTLDLINNKISPPQALNLPDYRRVQFSKGAKTLTFQNSIYDHKKEDSLEIIQVNLNHEKQVRTQKYKLKYADGLAAPDGKSLAYTTYENKGITNTDIYRINLVDQIQHPKFGDLNLEPLYDHFDEASGLKGQNSLIKLIRTNRAVHLIHTEYKTRIRGAVIPSLDAEFYFDLNFGKLYSFNKKQLQWSIGLPEDQYYNYLTNAAFGQNGQLAVLTMDQKLKIYTSDGMVTQEYTGIDLKNPSSGELFYDSQNEQVFLEDRGTIQGYDLKQQSMLNAAKLVVPSSARLSHNTDLGVDSPDQVSFRIFNKADKETICTLVIDQDNEWIVSTPSGLFDGSEKGKSALHYVKGMEIIPLESLEARYWVPDLLEKLLDGQSAKEIRDVSQLNLEDLYPIIQGQIENDVLQVKIQERSGGLGELNLYINGSIVQKDINPSKESQIEVPLKRYAKHFYTQRPNTILLQAFNKGDWMKSRPIELPPYSPSFAIQRDHKKAHFYAVVVGTSDYSGEQLDLNYAGKDAVSIHKALRVAGEALFQDRMDIRLFSTDDVPNATPPSKTNILAALGDIKEKAEPIDLVLIYFAGHGKVQDDDADKPRFFYLTQSINSFAQLEDPQARKLDAISQEELTDWLIELAAKKKVMILDACNSGQVVNTLINDRALTGSQLRALDRMKDRTGMYILAGSAADKKSYEATPYGQGLLTYSLLQGMQELSTQHPNKEVDILSLLSHAENRVPELAKEVGVIQKPKMHNQDGLSSFPIGIVQDPAAIPIASSKPLLIRPMFQQEGEFDDPLLLMTAIEDYIQKAIRRNAPFTFQDVRNHPNGYSIRGAYTMEGERINIKGFLYKAGKKIKEAGFSVEGTKTDMNDLAKQVFFAIENWIE